MTPDRPIVRLMAAVILAILACVASSAAQAHEGHRHGGRAHLAGPEAATQVRAVPATAALVTAPARPMVRDEAPARSRIAAVAPLGDDGCCPGPCRVRCCGTMACCATGILAGPPDLAPVPFRAVRLLPRDVPGRAGAAPEALPRPPRTLA